MNEKKDESGSLLQHEETGFEAIVLAGNNGSCKQETVPDHPTVLTPVAGKPFLSYVIDSLRMQGVTRFVFALGYKASEVEKYLKEAYPTLSYSTTLENEPIGTGGAIRLALQKTKSEHVLIVNGNTLFKINVALLFQQHYQTNAACTLALKEGADTRSKRIVRVSSDGQITGFKEKKDNCGGLIYGGINVLNKSLFFRYAFPHSFSFEKDYLENYVKSEAIFGKVYDGYFIDISIPEDLARAQTELALPHLDLSGINRDWTLFIDRDGVINEETVGEYVLHWEQFIFSKGVLQAFKTISDKFGRLLLVTNQRGVGKGLMSKEALDSIHFEMQREIAVVGGHLDKIYFCTDVHNSSFYRKPNPGMALQAKRDFPEIDFSKSIMVGNKPSDMRFGRAAGMFTVFLATTNPDQPFPHPDIDLRFDNLAQFAAAL